MLSVKDRALLSQVDEELLRLATVYIKDLNRDYKGEKDDVSHVERKTRYINRITGIYRKVMIAMRKAQLEGREELTSIVTCTFHGGRPPTDTTAWLVKNKGASGGVYGAASTLKKEGHRVKLIIQHSEDDIVFLLCCRFNNIKREIEHDYA